MLETDPSLAGYDEVRGRATYEALLTRLRSLPGVEAASFASMVPFGAFSEGRGVQRVGSTAADGAESRLPVLALKTLEDFRADSAGIWLVRAGASVFTTFGALALFLAVIGLYGVKAYVVSRRTREIGIRMALGADRGDVLWLGLREGLVLTLSGLGLGLLLSVGTAQLLSSLLYEVSTLDPVVFILAPLSLAASTLLASYLPARRATRVVPMVALRYE